jgi:beta-lactamase class A
LTPLQSSGRWCQSRIWSVNRVRVPKWVAISIASVLVLALAPSTAQPARASTISELALQSELTSYFSTRHAHYTLSLREIGGAGHQVGIDDTRHIEPASVVKLFWAWATLKKVDDGHLNLNSTLRSGFTWSTCLNLMIKVSDNECSAWIRDSLGISTLNQQLVDAGYPDTHIVADSKGRYKTKYTSAADTSLLLERLERGTLLSPASTLYFHNLLKAQTFRTRITPGVQKGVVVENKGGNLWITSGWTESDAAIVRGPHSTYILVIYGRDEAKKAEISAASKIVYEHLQNQAVTVSNAFPRRQYLTRWLVWVRKTPGGRGIYQAKKNVPVEVYYADRDWVKIKQNGKTAGFVRFSALTLSPDYIWP